MATHSLITAKVVDASTFPRRCADEVAAAYGEHQRATRRSSRAPARTDAHPMRDDPVVTDLVTRARNGDKQAWDALVDRYAPLVWSICRRHRLSGADANDVGQSVWLQLVDQLDHLREPAALPGWLATTTRRECGRILRGARGPDTARSAAGTETVPDERAGTVEQDLLAGRAARRAARGVHAALQRRMGFTNVAADARRDEAPARGPAGARARPRPDLASPLAWRAPPPDAGGRQPAAAAAPARPPGTPTLTL